jgi:hypothetical protein
MDISVVALFNILDLGEYMAAIPPSSELDAL